MWVFGHIGESSRGLMSQERLGNFWSLAASPATTPLADEAASAFEMLRRFKIAWIIVLVSPTAYSENDEEILEVVRANGTKIALEQASWTLPESFHESGLAPSDKGKLIEQWANATGACLADALATYAETTDVTLSEMVADDGSFGLKGDGSSSEFQVFLDTCIERAWEAVGASRR